MGSSPCTWTQISITEPEDKRKMQSENNCAGKGLNRLTRFCRNPCYLTSDFPFFSDPSQSSFHVYCILWIIFSFPFKKKHLNQPPTAWVQKHWDKISKFAVFLFFSTCAIKKRNPFLLNLHLNLCILKDHHICGV